MSSPFEPDEVVRSEEELDIRALRHEIGRIRGRKVVDHTHVEQVVPVAVEHAEPERVPVGEDDSGEIETLPDGSVSIPVFEEQLVVEKRLVVRERIIIRKHTVYEDQKVSADLRRELIRIDVDEEVADRVITPDGVGGDGAA